MRKGHYKSKCPDPKVKCDRCGNPHHTKIHDTVVEEIKRREEKGKGAKQAVRSGSAAEGAAKRAGREKVKSYAAGVESRNEAFEDMIRYHEAEQSSFMDSEVEGYAAALGKEEQEENFFSEEFEIIGNIADVGQDIEPEDKKEEDPKPKDDGWSGLTDLQREEIESNNYARAFFNSDLTGEHCMPYITFSEPPIGEEKTEVAKESASTARPSQIGGATYSPLHQEGHAVIEVKEECADADAGALKRASRSTLCARAIFSLGNLMQWLGRGLIAVGLLLSNYSGVEARADGGMLSFGACYRQAEIVAYSLSGAAKDEMVIDTACTKPLFMLESKKYLTDVKMENHSAVGIVGEQAKITHIGLHPCKYVGKVYCSKDVKVNLMSVPVMMDNGCTIDGAGMNMHIRDPAGAIVFHGKRNNRGLYVCPLKPTQALAFPATVDEVDEFDFRTMKPGMSEGEFYRFVHGHFTQEERKRAIEAWALHSTMGHMGRKALGDALENGLYAGCNLTRRDVDNAYKIFGRCNACLEGKYQLPSEPPSETEPCPSVGHTLNVDLYIYRVTTLGGYNYVVIATDQKSGAILHAPIKKKTAECVLEGIMRIVGSLNKFQHKVHKIVFDSEAVFLRWGRRSR
jgi:hypothetical protein